MFTFVTLQRNGWTHGSNQNLCQCQEILLLAWNVRFDMCFDSRLLTCQNNKPKPKHRNEVPLEEWQNETVPFRTIHIDHKRLIHPNSASNVHSLLIVDAFSQFLMIYPVRNTRALATITAVEKWILSFGIPQSIIHDPGTAFVNTEFIN